MKYFLHVLCFLLLTSACATKLPKAQPQASFFETQVIPASRSRALLFSLHFNDSLPAGQITGVYINEHPVPYRFAPDKHSIEIRLTESPGNKQEETSFRKTPENVLFDQLIGKGPFTARVLFGDQIVTFDTLKERKTQYLAE